MSTFSDMVRAALAASGKTRKDMAPVLGCSQATAYNRINDAEGLRVGELRAIGAELTPEGRGILRDAVADELGLA